MTPAVLLNHALLKIGVSQGVTAVDDATREAYTGGVIYDSALRYTLRRFPWPFATKYAGCTDESPFALYLVAGPLWNIDPAELTLVQAWSATALYTLGDVVRVSDVNYTAIAAVPANQTPPNATYWSTDADDRPDFANGDWAYAYRWPTDCLFVRRVVPQGGDGRKHNPTPIPFRIGRDTSGLLIYTNEAEATIEYTMVDCDNLWTDDLWLDAFTWRLAGLLAPNLTRNGLTQQDCFVRFEHALQVAAVGSAQEQQQAPGGLPDWIANR
jgi:hypothetical protein